MIQQSPLITTINQDVVVGPDSATDNAVVRFDGTTGKLIQDSTSIIDDSGNLTVAGTIAVDNASGGAILNEAVGTLNPTIIPNKADTNTGLSQSAANNLILCCGGNASFSVTSSASSASNANAYSLLNEASSATNPTLCPNKSDSDTGIGHAAADSLSLIAGGVEGMRLVEAAAAVKVGIGVATPDEKLHVVGSIKMVDGNESNGHVLTSDAAGVASWQAPAGGGDFSDGGEAGGADRTLGNTDNYDLGFLTNNTNRLHIQNDGLIGIGNTTPGAMIDITPNGDAVVGCQIEARAAQSGNLLEVNSNGGSGGDYFGLDENGNVITMKADPFWNRTTSFFLGVDCCGAGNLIDADYYNLGIGTEVFYNNTSGNANVAIGYQALKANTTGYGNVGLGYICLTANTEGFENIAIGKNALSNNTSGARNIAIGYDALLQNIAGNYNVAIGTEALKDQNDATAWFNIAIGYKTMENNIEGHSNLAIGYKALNANTTGYRNLALGGGALERCTTGYNNFAIGVSSLNTLTNGLYNYAIGFDTLHDVTNARYNVAIGQRTLYSLTTGDSCIGIGYRAGYTYTINNNIIAIGTAALEVSTADACFAIGAYACNANTTGTGNLALGDHACYRNQTGKNNIGIGVYALSGVTNTSTSGNIAIGNFSQQNVTTGSNYNITIGYKSGQSMGANSTQNIFIGYQTGNLTTTGDNNIIIGYDLDPTTATASNELNIGGTLFGNLSTDRIGINTSAPDKALEINTATGGEIRLTYNDANGSATDYCDFVTDANGGLTVTTVDSDGAVGHINFDPDGNVGIGDAAPGEKLDVNGSVNVTSVYKVSDTQVVGSQQAHIIDADGTLADITTKFNTLLSYLDADAGHGLLAGA